MRDLRVVGVAAGLAALIASAGCSGDDSSGDGNGEDPFGNAGSNTAGSGSDAPGASDDDDDDDGASGGFGPSANPTGDLYGDDACKRVDLVISVDGSESMTEELEAMRTTVFPAFAQRLAQIGSGLDDFRVATLDACPNPASYHTRGTGGECNFDGGSAWIESSSSAMDAEFACVGDIFQGDHDCSGDNDDEQPASSIAASMEAPMADGPNQGFRRGDALLVAVAITDEDEQPTGNATSPQDVYSRLLSVVGDPRRMVFLGIAGGSNCQGAYGEADNAQRMQNLVDRFDANDRGIFWDLCEGRLEDGLEEAFRVIEAACNELPPPCSADIDDDCWPADVPPGGDPQYCINNPDDPGCQLD